MQVDRPFVDQHGRTGAIHLANDLRRACAHVLDDDVVGGTGAQGKAPGRVGIADPGVATVAAMQRPLLGQDIQHRPRVVKIAKGLARLKGQLKGRAGQVVGHDCQVVRVKQGLLDRLAEKVARVSDQVLVEREGAGDQHRDRGPHPPPGPPGLLPGAGDGARVASHHATAQLPDVHPQFERVGRDDAAYLPLAQPALNTAPFAGEVAAPVALHRLGVAPGGGDGVAQVGEQHLGGQAGAGKDDGLHVGLEETRGNVLGRQCGAAPDAQLCIHQRRVVQNKVLCPLRSAVVVHQRDGRLDQMLGQFARVGDGGGGAEEARIGAVKPAHPPQPP